MVGMAQGMLEFMATVPWTLFWLEVQAGLRILRVRVRVEVRFFSRHLVSLKLNPMF